jgi:site-specific recombinase XerD
MDIEAFLSNLNTRQCSPGTIAQYESDLRVFEAFLKEKKLRVTQVRPRTIGAYVKFLAGRHNCKTGVKGLAIATVRRRLASVSSFYEYLRGASDGKIANPLRLVRRVRRPARLPESVPEPTIEQLLQGIVSPRDKAIFALFVASGLRLSELHQLNRGTIKVSKRVIDGELRTLGVGRVLGKGRKERDFLVDLPTLKLVATYLLARGPDGIEALFISARHQRMSTRAIKERLHYWCQRLGIGRIHVHALRHVFATRLANAGIPGLVLQQLMGHENFAVTQQYFRIEESRLAREYFAAMETIGGEKHSG